MTDATIEVTGLRKRYGSMIALDGMTFTVRPGKVTGFVGPNGAGKSTTIRVILGLDAPDEGKALVSWHLYQNLSYPLRHVGALVDAAALDPRRSGRNHLLWLAYSQRITKDWVDAVIEKVGLGSAARRRTGGYSLGMRQRLGIAAVLLGDPPIIILDEPFNGMDPEGIIWLRGFLRSLANEGRAVLVSSHLMNELQDIADHVVVVGKGSVLADADVEDLLAKTDDAYVRLRTSAPVEAERVLSQAEDITLSNDNRLIVFGMKAEQIVEALNAAQVPFSEVTEKRTTLEDVYLQLTSGETEFRAVKS